MEDFKTDVINSSSKNAVHISGLPQKMTQWERIMIRFADTVNYGRPTVRKMSSHKNYQENIRKTELQQLCKKNTINTTRKLRIPPRTISQVFLSIPDYYDSTLNTIDLNNKTVDISASLQKEYDFLIECVPLVFENEKSIKPNLSKKHGSEEIHRRYDYLRTMWLEFIDIEKNKHQLNKTLSSEQQSSDILTKDHCTDEEKWSPGINSDYVSKSNIKFMLDSLNDANATKCKKPCDRKEKFNPNEPPKRKN